MDLSEGKIIQINATVITGILILLTFSNSDSDDNQLFQRTVGSVYDAVASIILPFSTSAVIAICIIVYKELHPDFEKLKILRSEKILQLEEKIKTESDKRAAKKLEKELKKTRKRLDRVNENLAKYDEERFYSKFTSWRTLSLGMMIGFFYITIIILIVAFSE